MVASFLRKRRPQSSSHGGSTSPVSPTAPGGLRHSLSLPDLTTPLLDPASWVEVPPFAFGDSNPKGNSTPNGSAGGGRNRKPSLVGNGTDVQFHRPFTPKMISPVAIEEAIGAKGDFRVSNARWGRGDRDDLRESFASGVTMNKRKSRKRGYVGRLNVLLAGGKGSGKTSFVDLLVASLSIPEDGRNRNALLPSTSTDEPSTPVGSTIRQPVRPTTCPTARTVLSNLSDRLLVRLIDTPGLELDPNDEVKAKERERGVLGLLRIIEDRFEKTLREERKVRRQVGAADGLVHLVIYLIDAREVLRARAQRQAAEIDWSYIDLFEEASDYLPATLNGNFESSKRSEAFPQNSSVALSAEEIDIIRRLSRRANVLPVLSHADALTTAELKSVRAAVRRDLGAAFADALGSGFGLFGVSSDHGVRIPMIDEENENINDINMNEDGSADDNGDPAISTPSAAGDSDGKASEVMHLPYAIFSPETSHLTQKGEEGTQIPQNNFTRQYSWGSASALSPQHSDFPSLRETILVDRLKDLQTSTREVLYEEYRTERLIAKS